MFHHGRKIKYHQKTNTLHITIDFITLCTAPTHTCNFFRGKKPVIISFTCNYAYLYSYVITHVFYIKYPQACISIIFKNSILQVEIVKCTSQRLLFLNCQTIPLFWLTLYARKTISNKIETISYILRGCYHQKCKHSDVSINH